MAVKKSGLGKGLDSLIPNKAVGKTAEKAAQSDNKNNTENYHRKKYFRSSSQHIQTEKNTVKARKQQNDKKKFQV